MSQTSSPIHEPVQKYQGPTILSAGHRPFFLLTALSAVVLLPLWLLAFEGEIELGSQWHAHEMLYGFAGAAIAGFMMAAVPKWTNVDSPVGLKLALFVLLWIVGRIGMFMAELDKRFETLAYLDVLFLPVLTIIVARMIITARNVRNYVILAIFLGLVATNLGYHFYEPNNALHAGIYMIATLAALIGGRVVPAFTQNALRQRGDQDAICATPAWTDISLLMVMPTLAATQLFGFEESLTGGLSGFCSLILFIRMIGWKSLSSYFDPIVWILHVAYIWLPIGFGLKALSELTGTVDSMAGIHALTTGGIGLLVLAVASRAALGHSGRELKASGLTVLSYVLVIASAILRVLADTSEMIVLSGALWVLGYGLFAIVYLPILLKPRIDGLTG
ncbi:MAG: NnrS family protein [Methylocystaceae bacterium]|nr:NnrS family protein [Methylocystaceae bacterium]